MAAPESEGLARTIKIVVVGEAETGKTAVRERLVKGEFSDRYKPTIWVDFLTKQMSARGEDVKLQIWGLAQ